MNQQMTPGAVRTATPFIIGLLGSWLTRQGLNINDDLLAAVLVPVYGYSYYLVARFLEVYVSPRWKYILGLGIVGTPPVYVDPPAVVTDRAGTEVVGEDQPVREKEAVALPPPPASRAGRLAKTKARKRP